MRYGSVCSGIEAASVAWRGFGWDAAWLAEIEPFPCAVLKHHYPDVPNLGDMTTLPARILAGEVEAPDILVGGTPCQSFSVAGLRQGLKDPRGQLTRTYVEILDALDAVRSEPALCLWENVPGVLSDKDNAFGNFLGALAGEDAALEPPGGKWTNAGLVLGPAREVAWRVLDAQYFGVAQRRRRVFVVAGSPAGRVRPSQVLLVEQGVRRHSPPSREARQGTTPTLAARTRVGGGEFGAGLDGGRGGVGTDCYSGTITGDVAATMGTPGSSVNASGPTVLVRAVAPPRAVAFTTRGRDDGLSVESQDELAYALKNPGAGGRSNDRMVAHVVAPPLTATNDPSRSPQSSEVTAQVEAALRAQYPLAAAVAFQPRIARNGRGNMGELVNALNAQSGETGKGDAAPCVATATTIGFYPTEGRNFPAFNELSPTVKVGSGGTSGNPPGVMSAMVVDTYNGTITGDVAVPLSTMGGAGNTGPSAMVNMAVRRLTPVECERLQGFPDDYTLIPWKRKPASECPDGPRYKALGNSMAVPVMRWIGKQVVIASL